MADMEREHAYESRCAHMYTCREAHVQRGNIAGQAYTFTYVNTRKEKHAGMRREKMKEKEREKEKGGGKRSGRHAADSAKQHGT